MKAQRIYVVTHVWRGIIEDAGVAAYHRLVDAQRHLAALKEEIGGRPDEDAEIFTLWIKDRYVSDAKTTARLHQMPQD